MNTAEKQATYKVLNTRLKKTFIEIDGLKRRQQTVTSELKEKMKQVQSISDQMNALREKEIVITEHAVLRYLERVKGIDIESIKKEMLPVKVKEQIETLGGEGKYPIGLDNPGQLILKNNVVVSVYVREKK
jgi:hypothetical protein